MDAMEVQGKGYGLYVHISSRMFFMARRVFNIDTKLLLPWKILFSF